jgi:hypothetical protein
MLKVFRITNELSLLLQRKDQNIVEAMSFLIDVKERLIRLRNEGWDTLLEEVKLFCVEKKFQYQIWMRQYQDLADQGLVVT